MSRLNRAEEVSSISERRPDERRTTNERKESTMPDGAARTDRLSVSLVIPCFREEATVATTLRQLDELARRRAELDWEMIVVDDGSDDATSAEVACVAEELPTPVVLLQHRRNAGLGAAMRTGIAASDGEVLIAVDCDLSYSVSVVERLLDTWLASRPHIVMASPYMPGGRTEQVPHALETRSRVANRFLSWTAYHDLKTLTGMVRAYDGPFIRSLPLKAEGADIMVEIVYKAQVLRARIEEIPATLSWAGLETRVSRSALTSTRSRLTTYRQMINGYLWRPFWVPLVPALVCGGIGIVLAALGKLGWQGLAVACVVLSVTLLMNSMMSLQSKRYFEELLNLGFGLRRVSGVEPIRSPTAQIEVQQVRAGSTHSGVDQDVNGDTVPLTQAQFFTAEKITRSSSDQAGQVIRGERGWEVVGTNREREQ